MGEMKKGCRCCGFSVSQVRKEGRMVRVVPSLSQWESLKMDVDQATQSIGPSTFSNIFQFGRQNTQQPNLPYPSLKKLYIYALHHKSHIRLE